MNQHKSSIFCEFEQNLISCYFLLGAGNFDDILFSEETEQTEYPAWK